MNPYPGIDGIGFPPGAWHGYGGVQHCTKATAPYWYTGKDLLGNGCRNDTDIPRFAIPAYRHGGVVAEYFL
jgi:hypothetical protein